MIVSFCKGRIRAGLEVIAVKIPRILVCNMPHVLKLGQYVIEPVNNQLLIDENNYRKNHKISDTRKFAVIIPKVKQDGFTLEQCIQ